MDYSASFLFHGSLNDFLSRNRKTLWFSYALKTPAPLKDSIEAIGVPHVEVGQLLVNGKESSFQTLLQPADRIEVFPYGNQLPPAAPQSFVLDVHLGKLARLLRLFGVDSFYSTNLSDREIISIAIEQKRTVLTRDIGLLKHKVLEYGYWLRSQQPEEQLAEAIKRFSLCEVLHPFSRCLACNGILYKVEKEKIVHVLPEQTLRYYQEFYQCKNCSKVYWKGSHYGNMQRLVAKVISFAC